MKKIWISLFVLTLIILACKPTSVVQQNLSFLYDTEQQSFDPIIKVEKQNDTISKVIMTLNPNNIFFVKDRSSQSYISRLQVHYKVFESYSKSNIYDQDSLSYAFEGIPKKTPLITRDFLIKTRSQEKQYLFIKILDLNTERTERYIYHIDNSFLANSNNQSISNDFQIVLAENEAKITSLENISTAYVKSYNRYQPLSPLPYEMYVGMSFNYAADSSFKINAIDNTFTLPIHRRGFYLLTKKEEDENGILVNSFSEHFPYVRTVNDMILPLELLATSQEFNRLLNNQNRKLALDNFWVDNCGSRERAKPVIKSFYHRVEEANLFFTNTKQGWKTDRGMIYIIYGPPTKIYKNENLETWIYGEEDNLVSLNFVFRKIINPFSNNLYELNRSSVYKNSWYRMVDAWREGRIYTNDEE